LLIGAEVFGVVLKAGTLEVLYDPAILDNLARYWVAKQQFATIAPPEIEEASAFANMLATWRAIDALQMRELIRPLDTECLREGGTAGKIGALCSLNNATCLTIRHWRNEIGGGRMGSAVARIGGPYGRERAGTSNGSESAKKLPSAHTISLTHYNMLTPLYGQGEAIFKREIKQDRYDKCADTGALFRGVAQYQVPW
jgi:hypothetical protein